MRILYIHIGKYIMHLGLLFSKALVEEWHEFFLLNFVREAQNKINNKLCGGIPFLSNKQGNPTQTVVYLWNWSLLLATHSLRALNWDEDLKCFFLYHASKSIKINEPLLLLSRREQLLAQADECCFSTGCSMKTVKLRRTSLDPSLTFVLRDSAHMCT